MPSGGSHPRKTEAVRNHVSTLLSVGVEPAEIKSIVGCSGAFITQQKKRDRIKELGLDPYSVVRGRPRLIHDDALKTMVDFIEDFPLAYRDEVSEVLLEEWDIVVSPRTIGRYLSELKITHKRVGFINLRRDEDLIADFLTRMMEFTPDQLVALDESACNERTGDRKFGWSPRGQPCRVRQSRQRTTRWSILPTLTTDGWLDYEVYHGSFDGDRFFAFVERLVEKMNPWPEPHSVLVLDNVSTHHDERVQQLCAARGVKLMYLPPYSPHLNPIEMAFHEIKEWMRRHREIGIELENDFEVFVHMAMAETASARKAKGYFRECEYK
jgi:transposase